MLWQRSFGSVSFACSVSLGELLTPRSDVFWHPLLLNLLESVWIYVCDAGFGQALCYTSATEYQRQNISDRISCCISDRISNVTVYCVCVLSCVSLLLRVLCVCVFLHLIGKGEIVYWALFASVQSNRQGGGFFMLLHLIGKGEASSCFFIGGFFMLLHLIGKGEIVYWALFASLTGGLTGRSCIELYLQVWREGMHV